MRRILMTAVSGVMVSQLAACVTHRDKNPHNDVLIFGATTKVAIDVSAPIQNAAIPEFTLGYKRLEAVWTPLKSEGSFDQDPSKTTAALLSNLNSCTSQLSF